MIKIGFIVEGECEQLLIESVHFRLWAIQHDLEICDPVINVRGNSNLCPKFLGSIKI